MRSSPWLGLVAVLALLGLAAWSVIAYTGGDPAPRPRREAPPAEPSTGESLQAGYLTLRASPGLHRLRLEDPLSDFVTEVEAGVEGSAATARRVRVRLPRREMLELLLDAEWQQAAPGPVALTLGLEIPGRTLPEQTFWSEAKEDGHGSLADLVQWEIVQP